MIQIPFFERGVWVLRDLASFLHRIPEDERDRPTADQPDGEGPEAGPVDLADRPGVEYVGAWAGSASLASPEKWVAFARSLKLDRLDIMVNDFSRARDPQPFDFDGRAVRLCQAARAAGVQPHLTSWIMPHERFLREAADTLLPLLQNGLAQSLQWDAEEPWTQARHHMPYDEAAALMSALFHLGRSQADRGYQVGVNAIGYTPADKVGPLVSATDYCVPQCYATKSSGLPPESVVRTLVGRYKRVFGPQIRVHVGLAAYRQAGIPGHSVESAMRAALAGAQVLDGVDTAIYWSLAHLRKNARAAAFVRSIPRSNAVGDGAIVA